MRKLKYMLLLIGLFFSTLPQVLAVGDKRSDTQVASSGHTEEDYDDCYVCSVPFLSPW